MKMLIQVIANSDTNKGNFWKYKSKEEKEWLTFLYETSYNRQ